MLSINEQMTPLRVPTMTSTEELRKRILKLRWIGLEEEASRLVNLLAREPVANVVLIGPRDTD